MTTVNDTRVFGGPDVSPDHFLVLSRRKRYNNVLIQTLSK